MEGLETGLEKGLNGVLSLASGVGAQLSDALDVTANIGVNAASSILPPLPAYAGAQGSFGQSVTNNYYTMGDITVPPDSLIAKKIEGFFDEVQMYLNMGVRA
jgi:hypothetical protein